MKKPLHQAFAPYLAEANCCACSVCRAVDEQRYITNCDTVVIKDESAYWSAVSAQLQSLSEGTHRRIEWCDYVTTLPAAEMASQVSMSRGLWIGVGSGLHDRPHPPWVPARVYAEQPDVTAPETVTAPVQVDLFKVAA